jgi:hypothetical protein
MAGKGLSELATTKRYKLAFFSDDCKMKQASSHCDGYSVPLLCWLPSSAGRIVLYSGNLGKGLCSIVLDLSQKVDTIPRFHPEELLVVPSWNCWKVTVACPGCHCYWRFSRFLESSIQEIPGGVTQNKNLLSIKEIKPLGQVFGIQVLSCRLTWS